MRDVIKSYVLKRQDNNSLLTVTAFLVICLFIILLCNPLAVQSQEKNFPEPISPPPNATDIPVTQIVFSWKPFYVATNEYTFQLSKNSDMSDLVDEQKISGTTYKYMATLEYDTTYYWKLWASDPPGGDPVTSIFITESKPTSQPAPPAEEGSSGGFFDDPDWGLIGFITGGVIVVALCAFVFLRPRKPPARRQRPGWQGPMGPPQTCPACGTPNAPGKKFCGNCGAAIAAPSPASTMGATQTGVCTSCGSPNPPGRPFCGNCGAPAAPPAQAPAAGMQQAMPSQQQAAGRQMNICAACGTTNPPGQQFCGNCGANLAGPVQQQNMEVLQSYTCPICGAAITPNSNPCPNCGTWLDWG